MKNSDQPKVIMITGAAGYIGGMLCDQFSKSPELEKIIAIDMQPMPALLKDNKKIIWITASLYQNVWKIPAIINKPEVVIHCAWQIKELYDKKELQNKLNIESSKAVFEFALKSPFVKRIIHFSTIASYGAIPENDLNAAFNEEDELRETEARYGREKKDVEELLWKMYNDTGCNKQVFVLRPSSVTGPRGRSLVTKKVGLLHILKNVLPFIPAGSDKWCRQYVHEDDVTDAVAMFTFGQIKKGSTYDIYILSPNDYILAKDMGEIFKKGVVPIAPIVVRTLFFLAWHLSDGKIPTSKGGWRSFCYPIPVNGGRITKEYGFEYMYNSREALEKEEGRYS